MLYMNSCEWDCVLMCSNVTLGHRIHLRTARLALSTTIWDWSGVSCQGRFTSDQMTIEGFCISLELKASLENSLNFGKLIKSLNCFGKRVEGLEKFGICPSWNILPKESWRNKTRWLCKLPAIVAVKLVQELLRLFFINKCHAWVPQIGLCLFC